MESLLLAADCICFQLICSGARQGVRGRDGLLLVHFALKRLDQVDLPGYIFVFIAQFFLKALYEVGLLSTLLAKLLILGFELRRLPLLSVVFTLQIVLVRS